MSAATTVRPQLRAFTLAHFEAYAANILLDTGLPWILEDFQGEIVDPLLYAIRENKPMELWTVVPEGNAKTSLMAGVGLYCCDYARLPWIPVGASSRDQAEILAQQAYQMVRSSPFMLRRFHIYEGYRRIQATRPDHPGPGRHGIKVYAADVATGDGVIPYPLAICDEGHRYPHMGLYRLWKGKLRKRGASIAMLSTAGDPGGEFEEMRNAIKDRCTIARDNGAHRRYEAPRIVLNEWMVRSAEDVTDMEKVKQANPLEQISAEDLAEDFSSPTVDLGDWKRLKCNIPSRSQNAAIAEVEWEMSEVDDEVPRIAELGCDVGWKHDTFAIIPCAVTGTKWVTIKVKDKHGRPTGRTKKVQVKTKLIGAPQILVPPRDGSMLHPDEAKVAFDSFFDVHQVETVVMDMTRGEDIAAWLEDERGVTVIDWPQGNSQAAEDYETFMRGLREGTLKHVAHNGLRAHAMNAIARALPGDKRRFDRPSQSRGRKKQDERVIDALVAAAMVVNFLDSPVESKLAGAIEDYRIGQL